MKKATRLPLAVAVAGLMFQAGHSVAQDFALEEIIVTAQKTCAEPSRCTFVSECREW